MGYTPELMAALTGADRTRLIVSIATREGNAQELSKQYGLSIRFLRSFVDANKEEIQRVRDHWEEASTSDTEPSPNDLEQLWIANKAERLRKLQTIADALFKSIKEDGFDAATLREFRSYCMAAANELGQLLHRGSGDSTDDTLHVDIEGVDFERLK